MTALSRAQADVDRGDLGTARRRVASFVGSTSYNPEALALVADISQKMSDPVQAGRYWLLTPATGPEVDRAVEAFARECHHDARVMASELPHFKERYKVGAYPEVVRERLATFGIDAVFRDRERMPVQKAGWKQKAKALGCGLLVVGAVAAFFVSVSVAVRRLSSCP